MEKNIEEAEEFVEVCVSISMSKNVYIPKQATKEKTIELAKKIIPTPDTIINVQKQALMHYGIVINTDLNMKDWHTDEIEYVADYE